MTAVARKPRRNAAIWDVAAARVQAWADELPGDMAAVLPALGDIASRS